MQHADTSTQLKPSSPTGVLRPVDRGALGAYAPPSQISKMYNKSSDTVHNAPCVEERSTFVQKNTPAFHFLPTGLSSERMLSSGSVHSARTDWTPTVLVLLQPIR